MASALTAIVMISSLKVSWSAEPRPPGTLKLSHSVEVRLTEASNKRIPDLRWEPSLFEVYIEYDGLNESKVAVLRGYYPKPGWTLLNGDFPVEISDLDTGAFEIVVPLDISGAKVPLKAVTARGQPKHETVELIDNAPFDYLSSDTASTLRWEGRVSLQTSVFWGSEIDSVSTTKTSGVTWIPGLYAEGRAYHAPSPNARAWELGASVSLARSSTLAGPTSANDVSLGWLWDAQLQVAYRNALGRPSQGNFTPLFAFERQGFSVAATQQTAIASELVNQVQGEKLGIYWMEFGMRIHPALVRGRMIEITPMVLRSLSASGSYGDGSHFALGGWSGRLKISAEISPRSVIGMSAQLYSLSGDQAQSGQLLTAEIGVKF